MALLQFTEKGIYCPRARVYIDPWRPVQKALITHGHSDHARPGHRHYLCVESASPVIKYRLGSHINVETVSFGEVKTINGVRFSFHPAGHILGSAQIRVEYKGEVWVASGDYKTEADGLAEAFEPVPCHCFITESTFGLPVYKWKEQKEIFNSINAWWRTNKAEGKVTLLTGYALGKAQRIIQGLDPSIGTIYTHGAIENTNEVIRRQGIPIQPTTRITTGIKKEELIGHIIIAPPSSIGSPWIRKFKNLSVGMASGWMALRGARRRRGADRGFVLSDHADWDGLNEVIQATGAETVIATHGYTSIFSKWLNEQGIQALEEKTSFHGELGEISEGDDQKEESP